MNTFLKLIEWLISKNFLIEIGRKDENYFIIIGHSDFRKNKVDRAYQFSNPDTEALSKRVKEFLTKKEYL